MHGSLVNALSGTRPGTLPEIGMGATVLMWSDRYAATVVGVSQSGKRLVVQEDRAEPLLPSGPGLVQNYRITPNPDGRLTTFTLRQNGQWVAKGSAMQTGMRLALGYRDSYHDYSF